MKEHVGSNLGKSASQMQSSLVIQPWSVVSYDLSNILTKYLRLKNYDFVIYKYVCAQINQKNIEFIVIPDKDE